MRPVIDPFTFPKNLQEGMRSRLVCTVIQGDPPFAINWKKDDRPIEPGLGVIIRNDEFSSDLTFSSVTPRHNGNYTCIVSNAAASVSHTATLVVDGKSLTNMYIFQILNKLYTYLSKMLILMFLNPSWSTCFMAFMNKVLH